MRVVFRSDNHRVEGSPYTTFIIAILITNFALFHSISSYDPAKGTPVFVN